MPADAQALRVGPARLLDIDVDIADRPGDAHRIVHQPAGVRIGDETVARLQDLAHPADALNVLVRVTPHLELKAAVPLLPVAGDPPRHRAGRLLRCRKTRAGRPLRSR